MSTSSMLLPCLAFHSVHDRSTVLFSASEKKPIVGGDIGELENKIICPTTHGFMLARDPISLATFLWSPQSRQRIELPPLGLKQVEDDLLVDCTCLLSSKPSAPDCVVLLVEPLVEPEHPFIWYCRAGDSNWEEHEYDIGTQALPDYDPPEEKIVICQIAACRGKFYFNNRSTSLGVLDFCGDGGAPVFSSIAIDNTMDENYGYKYSARAKVFLLESDDELYLVRLLWAGDKKPYRGATVHMMDFSTRRWRRVDDLGGRTFLLSMYEFAASSEGGEFGLRQNCVYFMDNPERKLLQIFSVKDGSAEPQEFDDAPTSDKAFWMLSSDL
ncbi:unnamed protein product [Alopecurus aequalis]